jgi:DNA-binding LytR/AlgR family response regulator
MKALLKFGFNVLRNVSLVIVLLLVASMIYFEYNQEAGKALIARLEKLEKSQNKSEDAGSFGLANTDEPYGLESIGEYNPDGFKKFKIEIKGGFAYLRPSQIMYILSGSTKIIMTINKDTIIPKSSLDDLENLFYGIGGEGFFRIKSAIINCNYVQQVIQINNGKEGSYNYQNVVKMEDGEEINISKLKVKELIEILDDLSI